jgi:8-oxo-dGTP pyrophosphatase MutT (NUDIX family)
MIWTGDSLRARLAAVADEVGFRRAGVRVSDPIIRGDHDFDPSLRPEGALTRAAVLVPVVMRNDELTLLFTKRTDHLHAHAGQISFPGGRLEPDDPDAAAAALRETEEEIGLAARQIELIGRLDTYLTRTGFEVTPVVGLIEPPFDLKLDPFEVAEVFEVPLGHLIDPRNRERHTREFKGKPREYWAIPYRERYIWGATAGMLVNLADVLNKS